MFTARISSLAGDERTWTAHTEAELRVELRLVSHAGGKIASGRVSGPDGETVADWQSERQAWCRPDGEPWGVE